jgi:hypothetical protein
MKLTDSDWVLAEVRHGVTRPSILLDKAADAGRDPANMRAAFFTLVDAGILRWTWNSRLEEVHREPT